MDRFSWARRVRRFDSFFSLQKLIKVVVSYADFIFVTFLHFLKRVDPQVHERFLAHDAAFAKVYEASQPWLKKED